MHCPYTIVDTASMLDLQATSQCCMCLSEADVPAVDRWCVGLQDYERRFQTLFQDYSVVQQSHKQQASELEVLSKVCGRANAA